MSSQYEAHEAERGGDGAVAPLPPDDRGRLGGAFRAGREGAEQQSRRPSGELRRRVAELEEANAALRAEAERAHLILHGATDYAIISLDAQGRVTSWNEGARRILGYKAAEILGRSGEIWFLPEDRAAGVLTLEMCRALEHGRAANERWHLRKDGSRFWASGLMMPLPDGGRAGFLNILRDNSRAQADAEHRELLLAELNHRVKNTLAIVQSIAAQTVRNAGLPGDFRESFEARLLAMARSHDMLTRSGWDGAPLHEVAADTLRPHDGVPGRVVVAGPAVRLASNAVVTLGLAFHELATNAAKYGALSAPGGRVELGWTLRRSESGAPLVEIAWRERDGPPVRPPERRGFGSRLLERGLTQEFGGTVRLDFAPAGVECDICLPLTGKIEER